MKPINARSRSGTELPSQAAMRRPRSGYVLYAVGAALAVLASILLMFQATQRVRDTEVRLTTDEVIARMLARGAVETLSYHAERDVDDLLREPALAGEGGRLRDVLLLDGAALERLFAEGGDDARGLLEQLLGGAPFEHIRAMAADSRGAEFHYKVEARVPPPQPDDTVKDPVPKQVEIGFTVRCRLRHAEQSFRGDLTFRVYSQLAGVLGRFGLIWTGARQERMNGLVVDAGGRRLSGSAPVVAFHHPDDYDPSDPLLAKPASPPPPPPAPARTLKSMLAGAKPVTDAGELAPRLAGRGAVYLEWHRGGATLRIAAGAGAAGQLFQTSTDAGGKPVELAARPVDPQPEKVERFRATSGDVKQRGTVQGAVFGYFDGIDRDGLLGPPTVAEDPGEGTACVRPLGSAAHPSAGLVYGAIAASLAAITDLAIDRDDTGADEAAQAKALGRRPPERDTIDPFLRHGTPEEYDADLLREAGGQSYQRLAFFGSPDLGPGRAHDMNGPGMVTLDTQQWKYGALFTDHDDYARVMSRRVAVPYNTLLRAAANGDPQETLRQIAFWPEPPRFYRDVIDEAFWEHADPLHAQLAPSAGHRTFADTRGIGTHALAVLIRESPAAPRFSPHRIQCKGEELFRSSFVKNQTLNLEGTTVSLVPASSAAPPPKLVLDAVTVPPGGGGVLIAPDVTLAGVTLQGEGGTRAPLVIVAARLTLKGPGPFEGVYLVTESLSLHDDEGHALVRGTLFAGPQVALNRLERPLAVVFDPRMDPIGPEAHRQYRSALVWGAGPRITGAGGHLTDHSEYRRPAARVQPGGDRGRGRRARGAAPAAPHVVLDHGRRGRRRRAQDRGDEPRAGDHRAGHPHAQAAGQAARDPVAGPRAVLREIHVPAGRAAVARRVALRVEHAAVLAALALRLPALALHPAGGGRAGDRQRLARRPRPGPRARHLHDPARDGGRRARGPARVELLPEVPRVGEVQEPGMRRRGFSLTEVMIAAALAAVVLGAVMGALTHVSRGWRRADAGMARAQSGQRVLERLAEDLAHVEGAALPTRQALTKLGFPGGPGVFLERPRPASHIINFFQQGIADPLHSAIHEFVFDGPNSRYVKARPPENVKIPPVAGTESAIVVKDPGVTWLALSLGRGVEAEQVLWKFSRGAILRHGSISGVWTMTESAPLEAEVELRDQWLWVRTPAGHEGGEVFEVMLEVTLRAPHDPNLPGDPGFMTRRTITAGM
jgi:prepilin-type N-terminal cleavage/methylation domain-containing protein